MLPWYGAALLFERDQRTRRLPQAGLHPFVADREGIVILHTEERQRTADVPGAEEAGARQL